jgi:cell division protein FtsB
VKYSTPKIVQPRSRRYLTWLLLTFIVVLSAAWARFDFDVGGRKAQAELDDLRTRTASQQQRIGELEKERVELIGQVAILERSSQIDREAARQVQGELKKFQEQRARMEEELTLLRNMLSSKKERGKLTVQRFKLEPGAAQGSYRYRFTVSQNVRSDKEIEGWIFFAVDGVENGEPRWLPLRDITQSKVGKVKMRFKHFQEITGEIRLPAGFTPRKVIVEAKPNDKNLPQVKQRFDWVLAH